MPTLSYRRAGIRVRATAVRPGTALSSAGGGEIKRSMGGVKSGRWFSLAGLVGQPAFTSPVYINVERKINTAFD